MYRENVWMRRGEASPGPEKVFRVESSNFRSARAITIALALVAAGLSSPMLGLASADGGTIAFPVTGEPAQFLADGPVGTGQFETLLMVPWTGDVTNPAAAGYDTITLTPSSALLAETSLADVVQAVYACPVPTRTGSVEVLNLLGGQIVVEVPPGGGLPPTPVLPVQTTSPAPNCVALFASEDPVTPLEYAVAPAGDSVEIHLGQDNPAVTLVLGLRFTARDSPGAETVGLNVTSAAWATGTPVPGADVALEFSAISSLIVVTGVGPATVDASTVPQHLTADMARDYAALAVDDDGYYMAHVGPEWTLDGTCGRLTTSGGNTTATLEATNATGEDDACSLGADFGGVNTTVGPITVLAGAPTRLVSIVDATDDEVGDLSFNVGGSIALNTRMQDSDGNVYEPAIARWSVEAVPSLQDEVQALIAAAAAAPGNAVELACSFLHDQTEGESDTLCDEVSISEPLTDFVNSMAQSPDQAESHVCALLYATISDLCKVLFGDGSDDGGEGSLDHEDPEENAAACGVVDPLIGPSTTFTATQATNQTLDCRVKATLLDRNGEPIDDTDTTGTIHVLGGLASIRIEDLDGTEVGDLADTTDGSVTLYARGYDHAENPLGNVSASWIVNDGIGSPSPTMGNDTTVDFHTVGTGSVTASVVLEGLDHDINDTTGDITIDVGALDHIVIEDATGSPIGTHAMTADDTLQAFARGYDADQNLIGDIAVTWATTGDLDDVPTGPSTSVTFDPTTAPTTGDLSADDGAGHNAQAGTISVDVGALATLTATCPASAVANTAVDCDVTGTDADGNTVDTSSATFTAEDATGASVSIDGDGVFTAPTDTSVGPVAVNAAQDDVTSNDATVALDSDVLAAFTVDCGAASQAAGATATCTATDGADQYGNPVALVGPVFTVVNTTGTSLDVEGDGTFTLPTSVADGPVQVNATDQGITSDTVTIQVVAGPLATFTIACGDTTRTVNTTVSCSASDGADTHGNPVALDDPVYNVTNGTGDVLHTGAGTFTLPTQVADGPVSAVAEDQNITSNTIALTLLADALDAFAIDCGAAEQNAGTSATCTATGGVDRYGNDVTLVEPVFTVENATGDVLHSGGGTFSLPAWLGTLTVTAEDQGVTSGTDTIEVVAGTLASVTIDCGQTTRVAGDSVTCSAEAVDEFGHPVSPNDIVYTVRDGNGASIDDGDGSFDLPTLVSDGPVTMNATADGVESNVITIELIAGPLASFTIDCGETTRTVNGTVVCSVVDGADAHTNPVTPENVNFSATNTTGDELDDGDGNFSLPTLVADGPVTISATSDNVNANQVVIDLTPGAIETLVIDCGATTRTVNETAECSITEASDGFGNPITSTAATFTALDANGADLDTDDDGTFRLPTLVANGPVNVTATLDGFPSNTVAISLEPGPLAGVEADCPDELMVGHADTCSADAVDPYGNPLDLTISWSATGGFLSSNTGASVGYTAPTVSDLYDVTASVNGGEYSDVETVYAKPGDIYKITVTTLPAGEAAEVGADAHGVTIEAEAEDFFGNAVEDGTAIHWTLSDPDADNAVAAGVADAATGNTVGLGATSTTTIGGTTSVFLETSTVPGDDYKVTAKDDDVDPTTIRNSGTWTVVPGTAAHALLECSSGCTSAGEPVDITMTVRDQFNNTLSSGGNAYDGEKDWTFGGPMVAPDGTVPTCNGIGVDGGATNVSFTAGVATVSCTFYAAESFELTATNATSGLAEYQPLLVTVDATDPEALVFLEPATEALAGDCSLFTVQLQDLYGNPLSAGSYGVTLDDGTLGGTFHLGDDCGGSITTATIAEGDHSVNVFYANTENEDVTLNATASGLAGDAADLAVLPAVADHFDLACDACTVTAGANLTVTLSAKDEYGNTLDRGPNDYDAAAHPIVFGGVGAAPRGADPTCAGVVVDGSAANLSFTDGAVTVTCVLPDAGTFTLTADEGGISEAVGLGITIEPSEATELLVTVDGETFDPATSLNTGAPDVQTAGAGFPVEVRALDAFGNLVDGGAFAYTGSKALAFSGGSVAFDGTPQNATNETGAEVPFGETTNVTFGGGVGTTTVGLFRAETVSNLTVDDGALTGTASSVSVETAAATQVGILSESVGDCGGPDGRDCILASEAGNTTLTLGVNEEFTVRSASFDAYDNMIGSYRGDWSSDGLTPEMDGNTAFGLIWAFDAAGSGTITVASPTHSVDLPVVVS